ncbi:ABC transporter ATP-binding protein/permease [Bacteriovoracaceae bacterium]|nr:ABC transporter ATP-binding protein/permease [Bacteriovoracaceae bacterium]
MLDQSTIRAANSDEHRLKLFKKKLSIWRVFSSDEIKTLWGFLKVHLYLLLTLIVFSFFIALMEGSKSVFAVGLIRGLTVSQEQSLQLFQFTILGSKVDLSPFLQIETKKDALFFIFVTLLGISLTLSLVRWFYMWLAQRVRLTLLRDVRQRIIETIFMLDMDYFNQAKSGELMFLMNAESSRFSNIIIYFANFISYGAQVAIYLLILLFLHPTLTGVVFLFGILYYFAHIPIDMKLKRTSWRVNLDRNNLSQLFHQIIYGIKMIKLGGLEEREFNSYLKKHKAFEKQDLRIATLSASSKMFQEFLFVIFLVAIAVTIIFTSSFDEILNDAAKGTALVGYLFILLRFVQSGVNLQSARSQFIAAYGPLSRVMELINLKKDQKYQLSKKEGLEKVEEIKLKNLEFSYTSDKKTLDKINLNFKKNEMIALVGFSGSGKSTLLDILSGLRTVDNGEILIDGEIAEKEKLDKLAGSISYMNQEPIIFHESLDYNVRYFKPNASKDEVWKAIDLAVAREFVEKLPQGLNSGLGERGATISGGEKQRIGLARMFLKKKPILFLDEATNALDYKTELQFYKNLRTLREDRIIVVVAHRLSAVKDFDKIVMFNNGKVMESGTHQELMNNQSNYYNLYKVQESEDT